MSFSLRQATFLTALLLPPLHGGDLGSMHLINGNFQPTARVGVQLHSRLRTNNTLSDFYQFRVGPIVTVKVAPKVSLMGGYYFIQQGHAIREPDDWHRVFGGLLSPIYSSPRWSVESRTLYERFVGPPDGDFNRYRQRLFFHFPMRGITPYAIAEAVMVDGKLTGRFGGGIQWQESAWFRTALGYELRQSLTSPASHILTTVFQLQRPRHDTR